MLYGVRAGWPAGVWSFRELWPGQTSLPAALGKILEVGQLSSPDCHHLQQRHNQVLVLGRCQHSGLCLVVFGSVGCYALV